MNEKLSLELELRTTGSDAVEKLNSSFDRMSQLTEKLGKSSSQALVALPKYLQDAEGAATRAHARMAELGAGITALVGITAKISAGMLAYGSSIDHVMNGARALRFALAPTPFTAATIAVGLLTEKTLSLVSARGKLLEVEAMIAAKRGISVGDIERVGLASRISGGNNDNLLGAFSSLRGNISSKRIQSNLAELGVSDYARGSASPETLAQIALGLAKMEDPARRAKIAFDLFGESADKVLPDLNSRFAAGSRAVDDWSLTLDRTTRNQVFAMRRDMLTLKDTVLSLGTGFTAFGQAADKALTVAGAKSYAFLRQWDPRLMVMPGVSQFGDGRAAEVSDSEISSILQYGLGRQRGKANETSQSTIAKMLSGQASGIMGAFGSSREGLEGILSSARGRRSAAIGALEADKSGRNAGELTADQIRDYTADLIATSQQISAAEAALKRLTDAEEKLKKAQSDREALTQNLTSYSRSARDAGLSPVGKLIAEFDDKFGSSTMTAVERSRANADNATLIAAEIRRQEEEQKGYPLQSSSMLGRDFRELTRLRDRPFKDGDVDAGLATLERRRTGFMGDLSTNRSSSLADDSSYIAGLKSTSGHQSRMAELMAGSGGEVSALQTSKALQLGAIEMERERVKLGGTRYNQIVEMARLDREAAEAGYKYEEGLAALRQKNIATWKNNAMQSFDSLITGRGGDIFTTFARTFQKTVIGNLAEWSFGSIQKATSGLHMFNTGIGAKIFNGTPLGPDPLKSSTDANSVATAQNTIAIQNLSARVMGGAGGSGGAAVDAAASLLNLSGQTFGKSGFFQYGATAPDGLPTRGMSNLGLAALSPTGSMTSMMSKYGGAAIAAGGGTLAAVHGFSRGGLGGVLEGGAGVAAVAGTILPLLSKSLALAGPVGLVAGMGLGMISSFLGNSKEKRAAEISDTLNRSIYHAPTQLNAEIDSSGMYTDFDSRGNLRRSSFRGIPQTRNPSTRWENDEPYEAPGSVTSPYSPRQAQPTIVQHHYHFAEGSVRAIDTQDLAQAIHKARRQVADSVGEHMANDDQGKLARAVRFAVGS